MGTDRSEMVQKRIDGLVHDFPKYLATFEEKPPFSEAGQYGFHRDAINKRKALSSAVAAVRDDDFMLVLYKTLRTWGIGDRGSKFVLLSSFKDALRSKEYSLAYLDNYAINDHDLDIDEISDKLWDLIRSLQIVNNK